MKIKMLSVFQYSGITAKVRTMMGKMLTVDDYKAMIQKKTVQDVANYLKNNTYYNTVLDDINENSIHRGQLEQILKTSLIESYTKLFKFLRGDVKTYLKLIFLKYEIEELKMIVRVLHTEHNIQFAQNSLAFLRENDDIDIQKLLESKNIQQLIENLKGSVYYNVLSPFVVNTEHLDLFSIEMTLDMYFFNLVWKQKEKLLSGEDQRIITQSLGSETDVLNILWIHRCKKYYNIPNEIIYSYIIPYRYRLTKSQIVKMVEAKTVEELEQIVGATCYAQIFGQNKGLLLEHDFNLYVFKIYKKILRYHPFSIASIMAFIHLKEIEIRNLISIIEGIRYGLEPEQIKQYIVAENL